MTTRRRLLLGGAACGPLPAVLAALAGLAGCAGGFGTPVIAFSRRELQALLESRFPIDRRLLEVFDVQLRGPRLGLLPERNRVALELAIGTRDRLRGLAYEGRLAFDSELRWHAAQGSLLLAQVRVNDFTLDGAGGASARAERSGVERLGGALVERLLDEMVVYTLPPERAQALSARGLAPGAVKVTAVGVEVTLERRPA
jgi:hypothetical protein